MDQILNNCNIIKLVIFFWIIVASIGVWLASMREKANIQKGNSDHMTGTGSLKEGKVSFNFAIGIILIVIGLCATYIFSEKLNVCSGGTTGININIPTDTTGNDNNDSIPLITPGEANIEVPNQIAEAVNHKIKYLGNIYTAINYK